MQKVKTGNGNGFLWNEKTARPGAALWEAINLDKAEWRIKAGRIKAKRDHVVPLSRHAVELFTELKEKTGTGSCLFLSPAGAHIHIVQTSLLAVAKEIADDTGAMVSHGFKAMGGALLNGNRNHEAKGFTLPRHDKDLINIPLAAYITCLTARQAPPRLSPASGRTGLNGL